MSRVLVLRDVGKDGSYSRHYGIRRIQWNRHMEDGSWRKYKALCISIGTRDIIVLYWRLQ